ncbi:MAG: hypothetical protein KDC90_14565, partial [Ignavibacteriae bacterium]|nr:hypothetical protein [Ignavibacteriota bacterium]
MKKTKLNKFINFFWDNRYKEVTDNNLSQKIMMLSFIVTILVFFTTLFGILAFFQKNYLVGTLDLSITFLIILTRIYSLKNKNYTFLSYFISVLLGLYFLFLIYNEGYNYSGTLWSFTIPATSIFVLGRKKGFYYIILYSLAILVIFMLVSSDGTYTLVYKLRFYGAFATATIVTYFMGYLKEKMHIELIKKNEEINNSLKGLELKEKTLIEREKHYRTLFESSNDSIFLMDGDTFVDCKPKTLEM